MSCYILSNFIYSSTHTSGALVWFWLTNIIQQLLDHMNESAVYNESDLASFHKRLTELRAIVRNDKESGKHPEAMTTLLERQLNECGTFFPPKHAWD